MSPSRPDLRDETLPLEPATGASLALPQITLTVVEGSDRGLTRTVESGALMIGTDPACELPLTDAAVSRRHCTLQSRPEGWLLKDAGSTNGTFLDGHRVVEVFVNPGAAIRVGQSTVRLEAGRQTLRVAPSERRECGGMVGDSPAMRQLFALIERLGPSEVSVVLRGETGTGKEEAARALHAASRRSAGPFVVLDCGVVDRELISAQLFGHEVGAFTGATARRPGCFEAADGGTLFLDEIGELPLELQPKLLRALEAREVVRLGSQAPIRFDCRVLAATHRDLRERGARGEFREDLFFRLCQVELPLPPLRGRREDIPLLVERLVERSAGRVAGGRRGAEGFDAEVMGVLGALDWPGNVRELRNVVERALAMAAGERVTVSDLMLGPAVPAAASADLAGKTLEEIERQAIAQTLARCGGNKTHAARMLGVALNTLRDKIRRYGLAGGDVADGA